MKPRFSEAGEVDKKGYFLSLKIWPESQGHPGKVGLADLRHQDGAQTEEWLEDICQDSDSSIIFLLKVLPQKMRHQ